MEAHIVRTAKILNNLLITKVESKGSNSFRIHALTSNLTINNYANEQFEIQKEKIKKIEILLENIKNDAKEIVMLINQFNKLNIIGSNLNKAKHIVFKIENEFKRLKTFIQKNEENNQVNNLKEKIEKISNFNYSFNSFKKEEVNLNTLKLWTANLQNKYTKLIVVNIIHLNKPQFIISTTKDIKISALNILNNLKNKHNINLKGGGNHNFVQGVILDNSINKINTMIKDYLKNGN